MSSSRRSGTDDFTVDGRASLLGVARVYARDGLLLRAVAETSTRDAETRRAWSAFTEPAIAAVCERVEREIAAGRMVPFDIEGYVRPLVRMNLATFFEELVGVPEPPVEATVDRLHAIWTRTLSGFLVDSDR